MGYIEYFPKDHELIREGYTWGDHSKMLAFLDSLPDDDPATEIARSKVEKVSLPRMCEYCHKPEGEPHELECRDCNDPSLWVKREALAYTYLTENFEELHTTSTPMTDEEAVEYFRLVHFWFPKDPPKYITRKGLDPSDEAFHMMPWMYEAEYEAVIPIVRSSS